jgi:hypothetical protein
MIETMVRCVECGYDNSSQYRFCGMCGLTLRPVEDVVPGVKTAVANGKKPALAVDKTVATVATTRAATMKEDNEPVSGPSFLGLDSAGSGTDYLLEDEPSSGRGRMFVALVLLLAAAGFLVWRWRREGPPWQNRADAVATSNTAKSSASNTGASASDQPSNPAGTNTGSAAETQSAPAIAADPLPTAANPSATVTPAPATGTPATLPKNASPKDEASDSDSGNSAGEDRASDSGSTTDTTATQPTGTQPTKTQPKQDETSAHPAETASLQKPVSHIPAARSVAAITRTKPQPAPEVSESEALAMQGERYLYGNGVPQDCGLAQKSLQTAAAHASARAATLLGAMYATGHCATRNLPTAYRWFAKALHQDPSNTRVSADLEVLWRQMTADERAAATKAQ